MENKRIVYLDYLRVAAAVAVIVAHIANQNAGSLSGRSLDWQALNIYNSLSRWCVPVFLMISGSLFLSKEIPTKTLYRKYILRLAVAYLVWSVIYAVAMPVKNLLLTPGYQISLREIYTDMIRGQSHMWFLPMLIGIYMCVPILKQLVRSPKLARYYLILSLVFALAIPQCFKLCWDFLGQGVYVWISPVEQLISGMHMQLVAGYGFYFVLGWWLSNTELSSKQRKTVYLLGIVGGLSTVALNAVVGWNTQKSVGTYNNYLFVNVAMVAAAVFTWFQYRKYENQRCNRVIFRLAQVSFGVYLAHSLIIRVLDTVGINSLSFHPALSVPVLTVIVAAGGFMISFVLHKFPICRKWLV